MTTRIHPVAICSRRPEPDTAWYKPGPGTEKATDTEHSAEWLTDNSEETRAQKKKQKTAAAIITDSEGQVIKNKLARSVSLLLTVNSTANRTYIKNINII